MGLNDEEETKNRNTERQKMKKKSNGHRLNQL